MIVVALLASTAVWSRGSQADALSPPAGSCTTTAPCNSNTAGFGVIQNPGTSGAVDLTVLAAGLPASTNIYLRVCQDFHLETGPIPGPPGGPIIIGEFLARNRADSYLDGTGCTTALGTRVIVPETFSESIEPVAVTTGAGGSLSGRFGNRGGLEGFIHPHDPTPSPNGFQFNRFGVFDPLASENEFDCHLGITGGSYCYVYGSLEPGGPAVFRALIPEVCGWLLIDASLTAAVAAPEVDTFLVTAVGGANAYEVCSGQRAVFTATIDWGDGSATETGSPTGPNGNTEATHQYTNPGTYTITMILTTDKPIDPITITEEITVPQLPPPPIENGENHPPVAVDDVRYAAHPGNGPTGIVIDVLANDSDPDFDAIGIDDLLLNPAHGTATVENRMIVYRPDAGFIGTDSFNYRVTDQYGAIDEGLVTVVVRLSGCVLESGLNVCGDIEVGDILVENGDNFAEKFFGGSWWSHAGIVTGKEDVDGDGVPEIQIVDTIPGRGSAVTDIRFTTWNAPLPFGVVRPTVPAGARQSAAAFALASLGKPYTIKPWAGLGEDKYYCSGLVWRAYKEQGYDLAPSVKLPGSSGAFFVGALYITPDDVAENVFSSSVARRYVQANYGSGAVEVSGDGVELVVQDPNGRRVGEDAFGESWDEIAGAEHRRNMFGPSVVADGLDGTWTIEITARNNTEYQLRVHFPSAASDASATTTGVLTAGVTTVFTASDLATHPPRAELIVTRGDPAVGPRTVRLDASGSIDPDDTVSRYGWDYDNDGSVDEFTLDAVVEHTYPSETTTVTPAVLVEDASGGAGSARAPRLVVDEITGDFAPSPMISPLTSHVRRSAAQEFTVEGFAVDEVTSPWIWLIDEDVTSTVSPRLEFTFDAPGTHTVSVAPADRPELVAEASVIVFDVGLPDAIDDGATVVVDQALLIPVTANDTDGLDPSTLRITTPPAHGTARASTATGRVRYEPAQGYAGPDGFSYEVGDADGNRAEANVTISVVQSEAPVAIDDLFTMTSGGELTVTAPGVLGNDTGLLPVGLLEAGLTRQPLHGSTLVGPDGSFTYTPHVGYIGTDTFQYVAFNSAEEYSGAASVSIVVTQPDGAPVVNDQALSTPEDTPVGLSLGASDPDGDTLSFTISPPAHGTLTGLAPNLTYVPNPNFAGTDTFEFTAFDGTLTSQPARVTIMINAVNDPPEAVLSAPSNATEGDDIPLSVLVTDPDGPDLIVTWQLEEAISATTVPCFLEGSGTSVTMRCTDDATVRVRVSVSDGIDSIDLAATTDVTNAAPTVKIMNPQSGTTMLDGSTVTVTASILDPGSSDTHVCELLDSSATTSTSGTVTGTTCTATISPTGTGLHSLTMTVTDDDAGAGADAITLTIETAPPKPPTESWQVTKANLAISGTRGGVAIITGVLPIPPLVCPSLSLSINDQAVVSLPRTVRFGRVCIGITRQGIVTLDLRTGQFAAVLRVQSSFQLPSETARFVVGVGGADYADSVSGHLSRGRWTT